MINLMPAAMKQEIFYARRNTALRKWLVGFAVALAGVGIIVAFGLLYMQHSIKNHQTQIAEAKQSLQAQKVDETQKRVEEISANTKLATQVLSREILFSKLIRQIGRALPSNTVLKSLQIDKGAQGGLQLNAGAADFNAGTQLQINLQDPKNGVFEKADINSINCAGASAQSSLPCDVSLQALFSKNNTYLYITPTAPSAPAATGGTQ